jgi:hypothetical protein
MKDSLFILTVVLAFTILVVAIIKDSRKPKYEIQYFHGWWLIRDVKTKTVFKRFSTNEDAIEWFNKYCL